MTQTIILLTLLTSAADDKDQEKVQGTWQRVSMVVDGKEVPAEDVKAQQLTIKGNRYTLRIGKQSREGTLKLDSSKKPREVDIKSASGPNAGKVLKGIYELDGDTFKYCIAAPGKDRPTEFPSKPGTGQALAVNKRVKP
jgi:uncharacterized protein (TIGR03067 family)